MNTTALIPQQLADLAGSTVPLVDWRQALDTFLNTLSSPRTAKAYQRAVIEAMDTIGADYVADITTPLILTARLLLNSAPPAPSVQLPTLPPVDVAQAGAVVAV